jgi:uncharacterized OB-fold protein
MNHATTDNNPAGLPLPDLADPVTAPFWAATSDHRLTAPRCTSCQHLLWPPEIVCPECYGTTFHWEDVPHTGVIWSYATYHRALDPAFADRVPYVVGLVELLPEVKMYGIVLAEPDEVQIGHRVGAVFEDVTDEITLVRWRLV